MEWCTADYVILSVAAAAAVAGLFIGFSGAVAFLLATAASSAAGTFAWRFSAGCLASGWSRGLATVVAALLTFGLVRWTAKKIVNGLLRQPADAIFGALTASLTGALLAALGVYLVNFAQLAEVDSAIVREATGLVGL